MAETLANITHFVLVAVFNSLTVLNNNSFQKQMHSSEVFFFLSKLRGFSIFKKVIYKL